MQIAVIEPFQAVRNLAAFRGGADGVILSRKWSEMKVGNLKGAGAAIREVLA